MNTLTSTPTESTQIDNSIGEHFEVTDDDIEKLKSMIPKPEKNQVYNRNNGILPQFISRFTNKSTYLFERMQGNIELKGGDDFYSIKLLDKRKIDSLCKKYPKMNYVHLGFLVFKYLVSEPVFVPWQVLVIL